MSAVIDITLTEDQLEGTAATFSRWMATAGERIEAGKPLAEIETDKVALEIVAPEDGTLLELLVSEGDSLSAGMVIARLQRTVDQADEQQAPDDVDEDEPLDPSLEAAISLDADAEVEMAAADRPQDDDSGASLLSPSVRRLMRENELESLEQVDGSGRGGRITSADLQQWLESPQSSDEDRPSEDAEVSTAGFESTMRPHDSMRRRIASHMVESLLHTAPHVTSVFEMDMSAIIRHRKQHREAFSDKGINLTFTGYFVLAAARALQAVPEVNARFHEDALELFHDLNIGVGTALGEQGLIVPVIRQVQNRDLESVCEALHTLTTRARQGELNSQDVRGGTFTISNHGVSGSLFAAPIIINQPQVAILGIGKMENRLKVVEREGSRKVRIQPMCYVTLSIDHRALDAHQTNRWLSVFVEAIETWPQQGKL